MTRGWVSRPLRITFVELPGGMLLVENSMNIIFLVSPLSQDRTMSTVVNGSFSENNRSLVRFHSFYHSALDFLLSL